MPGQGDVQASYTYDTLGRLQREVSHRLDGVLAYDRTISYNASNQIATETVDTIGAGSALFRTVTTNNYGSGSGYALGAVVSASGKTYKNGNDAAVPDTSTTNGFAWFDGAIVSSTSTRCRILSQ